jgi:hypothetical protein
MKNFKSAFQATDCAPAPMPLASRNCMANFRKELSMAAIRIFVCESKYLLLQLVNSEISQEEYNFTIKEMVDLYKLTNLT